MSLPHSSAELVWSMRAGGGCAWNTGQQERGHEGKGLGGWNDTFLMIALGLFLRS